jgi:CBS domain containing-hemolysin-like protein
LLALVLLVASAFCSGTETALTALGETRARQLRDGGGRRARMLGLWIDHPERVLSTLLIGNTLVNIGAGALAAATGARVAAWTGWNGATSVAAATAIATVLILFFGEIIPKTVAKRFPVKFALAVIPVVRVTCWALWPVALGVTRATGMLLRILGVKGGAPTVTSEEIEYLIEMGSREGVLDEVKEQLLNSVLEFADRVAKEIMVPRTRMVAIDKDVAPEELVRIVTENPYSRMPVYDTTVDNVIGILLVKEVVQALRGDAGAATFSLQRHLKPPFFVPEQMKISRLLKEMQRRHVHLAIVVDEFGGTSGLVTLEDVLEEIVGEIQDEGDVEAAPVKEVAPGVWLADASVPLHDLEAFLNAPPPGVGEGTAAAPQIRFPEEGDYETLGGFVIATAGRVPPPGTILTWDGLTFTVRAADDRRVTRVEIARRAGGGSGGPTDTGREARATAGS